MRKAIWVGAAILTTIVGGVAYLLLSDSNGLDRMAGQPTATSQSSSAESPADPQAAQPVTPTPGAYVDYSADVIAQTSGTKILFFHAPWCPQCRALEADIKEKGVPSEATIIKVDYDSNQSLRQKYGVTIQTTLVKVDDQANLVEKFVAYNDPSVASVVENLLK